MTAVTNEQTVYIYTLVEQGSDDVRYVGQTVNLENRLIGHLDTSKMAENNPKRIWIEDILSRGATVAINVIEETNLNEARDREQYWIDHYIDSGAVLTNSVTATRNPIAWLSHRGGEIVETVSVRLNRESQALLNSYHERWPEMSRSACLIQLLGEMSGQDERLERAEREVDAILAHLQLEVD